MPRSGVTFAPELEWLLAAQWWGCRPNEFFELEGEVQSEMVATYRVHEQMRAVLASEQAREARAGSGAPRGRRK